jgi:tetratricopeptide (TPR) repeat protein
MVSALRLCSRWLSAWALGIITAGVAQAAPHLPVDDQQVVETLPVRLDPELSALAGLRSFWLRHPADSGGAAALVRAYVDAARRNGDPRFLGYAEAVLARFMTTPAAPIELRVLHATVLQSLHRFDAALEELSAVIALQPSHAQALLTRATILQLRGRFAEARRDCSQLWRSAGETTTALCLASVSAVTGGERSAARLTERALASVPPDDRAGRVWALTLRAEIAVREGAADEAAGYFELALAADPHDRYARAAYCDLLLQQGRAETARLMTAGALRDDNLLLRHTLALQRLVAAQPARNAGLQRDLVAGIAMLRERHAAARLRGDRTHLREEARLQLELLHDAAAALPLARENWAAQKEPADAELLLSAANAAGDRAARAEITTWLQVSGLHDARIAALLRQPADPRV